MKYASPQPGVTSARGLLLVVLFVLGGCAALPADNGRSDVDQLLAERGRSVDDATADLLASLIAAPLTPDSAIRIALLNNPALQSTYASLGFGAADVYEAGRIRNPVLGASVLSSSRSDERDQVTFGLVTSFTDLITLPARTRLAEGSFAALQQSVGAEVLDVAAQTEKAYYDYVGAQQVAALRAQIAKAGALSAALATRYQEAGNMTPRELALERAAASQAQLAALDAQATAYAARTALAQYWACPSPTTGPCPRNCHCLLHRKTNSRRYLLWPRNPGWIWPLRGHKPGCAQSNWASSTGRGGWANWILASRRNGSPVAAALAALRWRGKCPSSINTRTRCCARIPNCK